MTKGKMLTFRIREKLYNAITENYQQEKLNAMERGQEAAQNGQYRKKPDKELPFH